MKSVKDRRLGPVEEAVSVKRGLRKAGCDL